MDIRETLAKKRDGAELSTEEIGFFVRGVVEGRIADYQAAAWLMAVCIRGMNRRETGDLTIAMRDSGEKADLSDLPAHPTLDKHSTGGVGDKTTLVVVPLLASLGVPILKMSGRGLGFSGGTIDKLEAIPGFRTELSLEEARAQVRSIGAALIGQSDKLAPADKILYALRDVTATVESLPLIASSIMSKKLAAGADRILLDVKAGKGAFMKAREQAEALAQLLLSLGAEAGVPTSAVISPMDEPLGCCIGNALEVEEALNLLLTPNQAEPTFLKFCHELATHGLLAAEKATSEDEAQARITQALDSGSAARKFAEIVGAQGGPNSCETIRKTLPKAPYTHQVLASADGVITALDAEALGRLAMEMGAGRRVKADTIDPTVGIVLHYKTGDNVKAGEPLATLHLNESGRERATEFESAFLAACRIERQDALTAPPAKFWTMYLPSSI